MSRTETRPDEPSPWPLLRELGPEFMDVAVRSQVARHGPTAAWAIAVHLRADQDEVGAAMMRLVSSGEVAPDPEFGSRRHPCYLIAEQPSECPWCEGRGSGEPVGAFINMHPDGTCSQPRPKPALQDPRPGGFPVVQCTDCQGSGANLAAPGATDLWAYTLSWLARRTFTEGAGAKCVWTYGVTLSCPTCAGLGYSDRERLGTDAELERAEASPSAVHAVLEGEQWRITTRTWCPTCYGDDAGELGRVELTVAELIDFVDQHGTSTSAGEQLSVLGDQLEEAGDPWGEWIAALLNGSMAARREHEAAMAKAVGAIKARPRVEADREKTATIGPFNYTMDEITKIAAARSARRDWCRQSEHGIADMADAMRALGAGARVAGRSFVGFGNTMTQLEVALGVAREERAYLAKIHGLDIDLVEAAVRERGHDAVYQELQRGEHERYKVGPGPFAPLVEELRSMCADVAAIVEDPEPRERERRRGPVGDKLRRRLDRGRRR